MADTTAPHEIALSKMDLQPRRAVGTDSTRGPDGANEAASEGRGSAARSSTDHVTSDAGADGVPGDDGNLAADLGGAWTNTAIRAIQDRPFLVALVAVGLGVALWTISRRQSA